MEYNVGDIVKTNKGIAVITRVDKYAKVADVLFPDGTHGWRYIENLRPTRRSIDLQSVLEQIR